MSKKQVVWLGVLVLISIAYFSFFSSNSEEEIALTTKVKKEDFQNLVLTSGELQSTSSVQIKLPPNLRQNQIYQIKVQDLIAEGTYVKKGDYVARLDPSALNDKFVSALNELTKSESSFAQKKIDTTLTLKKERNAIKDLTFSVEEKEIELKQSIYESPSIIRQLEISLEKLKRNLRQKQEDYHIIKEREIQKMIIEQSNLSTIQNKLQNLNELRNKLTIYSESSGLLTYTTYWGRQIIKGSDINTYAPAIAILPDLTQMESKTYANEVDVRKIKKGQTVEVGFDAFPEIKVAGKVTSVANIGQNKQGSDIKLFQVLVKLKESNDNFKPGMTTSNKILTFEKKDVLTIPLECIFSQDSLIYVYQKSTIGINKKQVILGDSNNEVVIIKKGLTENDVVYLNEPNGYEKEPITLLE